MCLILLAHKAHPKYKLVLAGNRDEFYSRPTAPGHWWNQYPALLAGKDLQSQGTWFGITKSGKIAMLTNYRDPTAQKENAISRGLLVLNYLIKGLAPSEYLDTLADQDTLYNGYNLIIGTVDTLYYYSNKESKVRLIEPGIHGLSNHFLNTPWPKVTKGKEKLKQAISGNAVSLIDTIFTFLQDNEIVDDTQLPHTGVGQQWERLLSPLFIKSLEYGTRSSMVLTVDYKNNVTYEERSFVPCAKNQYCFQIKDMVD